MMSVFSLLHLISQFMTLCSQLKEMGSLPNSQPSVLLLKDVVREFRDDELEHLDTAVSQFSQRAPAHALLSTVVGGGCKIAIELCKRF
jgi:ubiquinone biosynthesis monooxygenase Coq7